jgi:hypothetical protein
VLLFDHSAEGTGRRPERNSFQIWNTTVDQNTDLEIVDPDVLCKALILKDVIVEL